MRLGGRALVTLLRSLVIRSLSSGPAVAFASWPLLQQSLTASARISLSIFLYNLPATRSALDCPIYNVSPTFWAFTLYAGMLRLRVQPSLTTNLQRKI